MYMKGSLLALNILLSIADNNLLYGNFQIEHLTYSTQNLWYRVLSRKNIQSLIQCIHYCIVICDAVAYDETRRNCVTFGRMNSTSINYSLTPNSKFYVHQKVPVLYVSKSSFKVIYGEIITLTCTFHSHFHTTIGCQYIGINGVAVDIPCTRMVKNNPDFECSVEIRGYFGAEGKYNFYATNAFGTVFHTKILNVTGEVPIVKIPSKNVISVIKGSQINLKCQISAIPEAQDVTWIFTEQNGFNTTINNTCRYSGVTIDDPVLSITNVLLRDEGNYTCQAANALGKGYSESIQLNVIQNSSDPCFSCPDLYTCNSSSTLCVRLYEIKPNGGSRMQSTFEDECCRDGADLIRIDSQEKQTSVENMLKQNYPGIDAIWIQGRYRNMHWVFNDNTPIVYTNWDHSSSSERIVKELIFIQRQSNDYKWFKVYDTSFNNISALCEYPMAE